MGGAVAARERRGGGSAVGERLRRGRFVPAVRSPSPAPPPSHPFPPTPRGFAPLLVLLSVAFLLLFLLISFMKLLLSQPTSVTLLIPSPIYRWGGGERLCGAELPAKPPQTLEVRVWNLKRRLLALKVGYGP